MIARTKLRIEDCRRAVQIRYLVLKAEMLSPSRYRRVAWPRQMAFTLALELTTASTTRIGRYFGGRDHTTVLWGSRAVRARFETKPGYEEDYENLRLTLAVYAAQIAQAGWEEIDCQAKAGVEAECTRPEGHAVEPVSRPAARRRAATTPENGRDGVERHAPSSAFVPGEPGPSALGRAA